MSDEASDVRLAIRTVAFYIHSDGAFEFHDSGANRPTKDRPFQLTITVRDPALYEYIWRQQWDADARPRRPPRVGFG